MSSAGDLLWLGSALRVPFSAVMLMVGDMQWHN